MKTNRTLIVARRMFRLLARRSSRMLLGLKAFSRPTW